jgi:II/X family phage/plasmid replication protein
MTWSAVVRSGTVYFGQKSRRVTLKLYSKGEEITSGKKGHGLCSTLALESHQMLLDYGRGMLRSELTLRDMELRDRGLDRASRWSQVERYRAPGAGCGPTITLYLCTEEVICDC